MLNSPASDSWKEQKRKIKDKYQYTYLIIQNLMFKNNPYIKKRCKKVKDPCTFLDDHKYKIQHEEMEGERKIAYV